MVVDDEPNLRVAYFSSRVVSVSVLEKISFQIFFIFIPKFGEDEPNLTSIFFRGVGSTAN